MQIEASVESFLGSLEPGQSFLLCSGEQKNNMLLLTTRSSLARHRHPWQPLMSSSRHTLFSVLTTINPSRAPICSPKPVFSVDAGSAKERPRVKKLRARLFSMDTWSDEHPWLLICLCAERSRFHRDLCSTYGQPGCLHHFTLTNFYRDTVLTSIIDSYVDSQKEDNETSSSREVCTDTPITIQVSVDKRHWKSL